MFDMLNEGLDYKIKVSQLSIYNCFNINANSFL